MPERVITNKNNQSAEKGNMRLLIILLLLAVLFFATSFIGQQGETGAPKAQQLIQYEVGIRDLNTINDTLLRAYRSLSKTSGTIFNGYNVKVKKVADGTEVKVGEYAYTAIIGVYSGGKVEKTADGKILVVRVAYERVPERGTEPPVVRVGSPLLSLFLLGPVSKDVTLTVLSPVLVLKSGRYVLPRKIILDGPCYFDTTKEVQADEALCMFVYPANDEPAELILAAYPSEEEIISRLVFSSIGYPVARLELR